MFADKADQMAKDATALVEWMKDAEPGEARHIVRKVYTESLRSVYIMATVVSFVALVASMFIKHYDLNQVQESDQGLECDDLKQSTESRDFEPEVERPQTPATQVTNLSQQETERRHIENGRVVKTGAGAHEPKKPSALHRQLSIR